MFLASRPSTREIERFLARAEELPLSYPHVGIAEGAARGYDLDETTVVVGRGLLQFERARRALCAWRHFELGWVDLFPARASIDPGTTVAVLARHLGFWSLHACRVVYGVSSPDERGRFGFAYGTLTNHAETGEELFEVSLRPDSDDVIYRIRAVSRPHATLAVLGYPIVRVLQARFRRDSGEAMRRAVRSG